MEHIPMKFGKDNRGKAEGCLGLCVNMKAVRRLLNVSKIFFWLQRYTVSKFALLIKSFICLLLDTRKRASKVQQHLQRTGIYGTLFPTILPPTQVHKFCFLESLLFMKMESEKCCKYCCTNHLQRIGVLNDAKWRHGFLYQPL